MPGKSFLWILCILITSILISACTTPIGITSTPLLPLNTQIPATKTLLPLPDTPVPLLPLRTTTAYITPTSTETNTLIATSTATLSPTSTKTPIVNDQVATCPGAPVISIKRNTWAQISLIPPISNNIRKDPGLNGEWIGKLKPGEIVMIIDGPRCADNYAWWLVQSLAGLQGWTAEGNATGYWLLQPFTAFFYDTVDRSSSSEVILNAGQKYRIVMSGTYSLWVVEQWTSPGVCIRGEYELNPMFPSPDKANGPVGADPYYRFARPFYGPCEEITDPNEIVSAMMFSLDGGNSFSIPKPIVAQYRDDHTYVYEVMGQGKPLMVKLDDPYLVDNYGQIFIAIEKME